MRLGQIYRGLTNTVKDAFPTNTSGLPEATPTQVVELADGGRFNLTALPVRKRLGDVEVRMLGYNGSIPGPEFRVPQGAEVTVDFTNEADVETTVHWHGICLGNRYDGVPHGHHKGMQAPIPTGESFAYRLRFPDPGIYWYHPHVREDYTQELGLYGNIVVSPRDPDYWAPVNREVSLVLDDILLKGEKIAPFSQTQSNRTAMGRYGDVMLVNGETDFAMDVQLGEVMRLYLTNTANVRPFNFRIPGARMKLVGGDNGRVEHEQYVTEVLITPSERVVVDVLFDKSGPLRIEHLIPERAYTLGMINVRDEPVARSYAEQFVELRSNPDFAAVRPRLDEELHRTPDKTLTLVAEMPGMKGHGEGHGHVDIEWEDTMEMHNRMTTPENMYWKLVDQDTGAANMAIDWSFPLGEFIKIRIVNDPHSDHPMQHPFHIHGQRFLVLSRDSVPNENLVWKDTVLIRTGEIIELLVEMTNPGTWMAHCHIAEHLEGGMALSFVVSDA